MNEVDNVLKSLPEILPHSLRVVYRVDIQSRAGPFMEYSGLFDLPCALKGRNYETTLALFHMLADNLLTQGLHLELAGRLEEHLLKSQTATAAAQPSGITAEGRSPDWHGRPEDFAGAGSQIPPTPPPELNKPADDCRDASAWAAYRRRLAEWKDQQQFMEDLRFAGLAHKSKSRPATATQEPADSPAPRRDTAPAATAPAPTPVPTVQKSASAQSPFQMPGDTSVPATPKRTPRESETKPPAFDPTPFKTVSDICSESPLAKAA